MTSHYPAPSIDPGPDSEPEPGENKTAELTITLYNVSLEIDDPRWPSLPSALATVQLPPSYTFAATFSQPVGSVRIKVDDQPVILDTKPPYISAGPEGLSPLAVGAGDRTGSALNEHEQTFRVNEQGTLTNPDPHTRHNLWQTNTGEYIRRDSDNNFIILDGKLIFSSDKTDVCNSFV